MKNTETAMAPIKLLFFKCPCCNGKGGYTEPVLDFGIGPYYPCDFCQDETKVGFKKAFLWFKTVTLWKFFHNLFCTIDEKE